MTASIFVGEVNATIRSFQGRMTPHLCKILLLFQHTLDLLRSNLHTLVRLLDYQRPAIDVRIAADCDNMTGIDIVR